MTETADVLTVECELPGVEREDVEVSMEGGVLRIRGERKAPETIPAEYHRRERDFGPFERTIELPVKVDVDNVKAKFSFGLLDIVLPKHPDSQPRRIEVKVG
jgi:HSP20 family protein